MHPFIEHLVKDHKEQRTLGKQLKEAQNTDDRNRLRNKMDSELLPHMAGEEASIFSNMQVSGSDKVTENALEAEQEHHVGRLVLRELLGLGLDSEVFSAKAAVLVELNKHHMREEEDKHFPWLEKHASNKELDELFKEYKIAEAAAK